jgi:hypothetical protein
MNEWMNEWSWKQSSFGIMKDEWVKWFVLLQAFLWRLFFFLRISRKWENPPTPWRVYGPSLAPRVVHLKSRALSTDSLANSGKFDLGTDAVTWLTVIYWTLLKFMRTSVLFLNVIMVGLFWFVSHLLSSMRKPQIQYTSVILRNRIRHQ